MATAKDKLDELQYRKLKESRPDLKPGLLDIRRYLPSSQTTSRRISKLIGLVFIGLIIFGGIYGFFYFQTDAGQRQISGAGELAQKYSPAKLIDRVKAQAAGITSWETEDTKQEKQGIVFKSLSTLGTDKTVQGQDIILKYDLEVTGTDKDIQTKFYCKLKGPEEVEGQILPDESLTLSAIRPTTVRCIIPGQATEELLGSQTIEAGGEYEYKTEDITLPVYITTEDIYAILATSEAENFFDYYNLDETNPIRVKYNGEPVEVSIGMSDTNIQPVVIGPEAGPAYVGISLRNKWLSGKIKKITKLQLELPEGVEINEELSPDYLCPFTPIGKTNGMNVYDAPKELLEKITIENELAIVECFLNIDPTIVGGSPYLKTEYKASAEYIYALDTKSKTITVKSETSPEPTA